MVLFTSGMFTNYKLQTNTLPSLSHSYSIAETMSGGGGGVADQISLFCSQLQRRRFDDGTLRILELILVSKDVKSLMEIRFTLREFLNSESLRFLREISHKTVDEKLSMLQFFVLAFALIGDVQSCMALKYEAFILRETTCVNNDDWLRVSYDEWVTFAKDALDNGFYSIAVKGCENAISCILSHKNVDSRSDIHLADPQVVNKIKKLKDTAVALVASHSVQAQAAEHLKMKTTQLNQKSILVSTDTQCSASTAFRYGIVKQNLKRLYDVQSLQQNDIPLKQLNPHNA